MHTSRASTEDSGRQLGFLGEVGYEKFAAMDRIVDFRQEQFGIDVVKQAVFLNQLIDHVRGGISREERTVDYDKLTIL